MRPAVLPIVTVRGAPFRANVAVYPYPEHQQRVWRIEAQIRVKHWRTGERGWLSFHCVVERPAGRKGPPPRSVVVYQARRQLQRALLHELDECLYVDGKRLANPHAFKRGGRA